MKPKNSYLGDVELPPLLPDTHPLIQRFNTLIEDWKAKKWGPCQHCGHDDWYQHNGFSFCGHCFPRAPPAEDVPISDEGDTSPTTALNERKQLNSSIGADMSTEAEAFPSPYLAASDFPQPQILTVDVVQKKYIQGGANPGEKYICFFSGVVKGMILNKTNWRALARTSGIDQSDAWRGVQIEACADTVLMKGEVTPCIRLRTPTRQPPLAATPPSVSPRRGTIPKEEAEDEETQVLNDWDREHDAAEGKKSR